jgi:hypothetical protein
MVRGASIQYFSWNSKHSAHNGLTQTEIEQIFLRTGEECNRTRPRQLLKDFKTR